MTFGLEFYLRIITDAVFIVVAFIAFIHFLRIRDMQHLYFAMLSLTLAAAMIISEVTEIDSVIATHEGQLFSLAVVSHPYLLLRIAGAIAPMRTLWLRLAEISMIVTVLIIISSDIANRDLEFSYILGVAYFIGTQVLAASVFWRAARKTDSIARHRYQYIFAGSVLLGLVILMLFIRAFFDPTFGVVGGAYVLLTALTAGAYFIGFTPPPFIRRMWQSAHVIRYQSRIISKLINKPAERILHFLALSSVRAVGGQNAILIRYDAELNRLSLNSLKESIRFTLPPEEMSGFSQLMREFNREPEYLQRRIVEPESAAGLIMDGFGAAAMFMVPVLNMPNTFTLLAITLRESTLFIEEDLSILRSFADQARAVLQNNSRIAAAQGLVDELRDETGDLEEMVIEREEALRASEDELRRRLVQTSALYRELESFSYSVSHDLRAPLRAITGFSTALLEDYGHTLPAEALEYLQRIGANGRKMEDLMNDMLKLSKLSRSEVAFVTVDLTELAVRVGHEMRAAYPAHEVAFSVEPGMTVHADSTLANVLVTTLLDNAWKFTVGTPNPSVTFEIAQHDGDTLYRVSDNGAGFDPHYAGSLFKPFQRLHTADQFEGNGIGLAIVQRIVNWHGGRVWAEGQPGRGARFYFTLPGRVT